MKKTISSILALIMLLTCAIMPFNAYAASKPKATTISSITAKEAGFTVKWTKVTSATGYQIQYSTSSKFAKDASKTVKITKASTTSKTVSGLNNHKKYYVRVRTYKTANKKTTYSSWTKSKNVTTKVKSTSISKLTAKDKAFTVKWNKVTNITGYQIQYSTNSKFEKNNKTVKITKSSTTSKTVSGLKENKKYYVRVRTYKTSGNNNYYSSWSKCKTTTPTTTTKHDHSGLTGNIGKWFDSRAELTAYYNSVVKYWNNKDDNGEITREEYYKNCPDGYECWSCAECGKWTGNFYY